MQYLALLILLGALPIALGISVMGLWHWDLAIPLDYRAQNADETWQIILTKMVIDTGWVLNNPYLGAPGVAHWYDNAAAQTSAIHSILMRALSGAIPNAVKLQQVYFLLNFSLISFASYFSCRLLGIRRLPAYCIAILFAFLGYRFNFFIYSFLSNYFAVPLALVAVFWVMTGEFSRSFADPNLSSIAILRKQAVSSKFVLGAIFVILIAISDGYYAFFTLLLLGFALVVRALSGDMKRPASLLVPVTYIVLLMATALSISRPLHNYKQSHVEEFAPNGVKDPALRRHPFEAEVYSVSLKLLVTPTPNHRVEALAKLGKKITATSDAARQYKTGAIFAPLGFLGSSLLVATFALLAIPALRSDWDRKQSPGTDEQEVKIIWASCVLAVFIFLCSISGGIGTLIALVYPTIRAYDRFPLFLIFVLYVGAGAAITRSLRLASSARRWKISIAAIIIASLSLYDQLPNNIDKGSKEIAGRYLAERSFVQGMEDKLPAGTMVYQYPYSQWLTNSPYYGWGSFAQVRLYLHSSKLRWSNGASKNSPIDTWHANMAKLPIDQLITEAKAAGFRAFVIDRRFVPDSEYQTVMAALSAATDSPPLEDESSKLTYFSLPDPGYRVTYEDSYQQVRELQINDLALTKNASFPRLVDQHALAELIGKGEKAEPWVIDRKSHPGVFRSAAGMDRGMGESPVLPLTDMKGKIQCSASQSNVSSKSNDSWVMAITNSSDFDWILDQGQYPIRIGVHIRDSAGSMLRWDDGWRLKTDNTQNATGSSTVKGHLLIPKGGTARVDVSLSQLDLTGTGEGNHGLAADFRMVQDGHAWFGHLGCEIAIKR